MVLYKFNPLSTTLNSLYRQSEESLIASLIKQIPQNDALKKSVREKTKSLIEGIRKQKIKAISIENFLQTYDLSSHEGIALMCLAEALLRIPDKQTQTALIRDKISAISWLQHIGKNDSLSMNIATLGLATTDLFLSWGLGRTEFVQSIANVTRKMTEPAIRQVIGHAMWILGHQFVMGETIDEALKRAQKSELRGYRHSYDMLGEGAKTAEDAHQYFQSYYHAIESVARFRNDGDIFNQPSISVKLSALHPRYELVLKDRGFNELLPKILELCQIAKKADIALTIDAEESERLELSLELFRTIAADTSLKGWNGLGLAVQAYQKRSTAVIDWIQDLGQTINKRLCVRLVKGAYWDSEIKKTQEKGLEDYPVFTRKVFTDISYLACAYKMFNYTKEIYPQFATHNAYTVSSIQEISDGKEYEFQRLHGMGEQLYDQFVSPETPCRIYAPVGYHRDLLAYLVRRLLENGANTSFVNKIYDSKVPVETMLIDPLDQVKTFETMQHPNIPSPKEMLMPSRLNSKGYDLANQECLNHLQEYLKNFPSKFPLQASPLIPGFSNQDHKCLEIFDPANNNHLVTKCILGNKKDIQTALDIATTAQEKWACVPVEERAKILDTLAEKLENHYDELIALLVYESGKTIADAIAEIREAVDFCRYYANQARQTIGKVIPLPGPTGEQNELSLHGRGVFVCISPWNFPLAIFLGQVTAALVSGNTVIAKPAQQTPYIAYRACQLALEAGIPAEVLHFIPSKGSDIGKYLLTDLRIGGVAFTGSTEVAWTINQTLSQRKGPIAPLIAETGGINAMIVDSSALPEQIVNDVIISAFQSAGQRCSALRLLIIQDDIADKVLEMLKGAMRELKVAHTSEISTDIGAIIDVASHKDLIAYTEALEKIGSLVCKTEITGINGNFIAPQAWEISSIEMLTKEVFGPILHIVRFKSDELEKVVRKINATGYGLTLGLHSRIDTTINYVRKHAKAGNFYVNRNMIGAVVGVQPFGGEGLSGTGPKAGGPYYLHRFTVERTYTKDTTAAGGNASLLASLG